VDPDRGDSHTDTVFNVIAGAGLNTFPLKPFGQFKYSIKDGDDPLQFAVGVRF
jgi:VCBS repeat-containing protein